MTEEFDLILPKLQRNYLIKAKTTFLVGGTVEYFIEASNKEEILLAVKFARTMELPIVVLGRGSDILFPDGHLAAVVIHINESYIEEEESGYYRVAAGTILNQFIFKVGQAGWAGMEDLIGIPGGIGGAVWANAGAYGTEIKTFVDKVSVLWLDTAEPQVEILNNQQCAFTYRDSIFKHRNGVIIDVWFKLTDKVQDWESTKTKLIGILQSRQSKHPLNYPNAGSSFKNVLVTDEIQKELGTNFPYNKIPAGWLIEQVGLKGYQIGGAQFSEKHANFIVNIGEAKASDILDLIALAKQKVHDKYGISLEEELIYVGK